MKKVICLIHLLVLFAFPVYTQNGYSFYRENYKWGVLYNGEPCLLPRYNEVGTINYTGLFTFKEDGKYGVANAWKVVAQPFCDSIVFQRTKYPYKCIRYRFTYDNPSRQNVVTCKYLVNGKWGVCSVDGVEILPPIYDEIYDMLYGLDEFDLVFVKEHKKVDKKHPDIWAKSWYYIVNKGGNICFVDLNGNAYASNLSEIDCMTDSEEKKQIKKNFFKSVKSILKSEEDYALKLDDKIQVAYKGLEENVIYKNALRCIRMVMYDLDIEYGGDPMDYEKEKYSPRQIYWGYTNGMYNNIEGDTITVSGLKSIITDYGFISTPLVYDSPDFRLKRNPMDVYAYLVLLEQNRIIAPTDYARDEYVMDGTAQREMETIKEQINYCGWLEEMAKAEKNKSAGSDVREKRWALEKSLRNYENAYNRTKKLLAFNARMDRFANTATSVLNSIASAYASFHYSASGSSNSSVGNGNANSSSSSNRGQGKNMSMADQTNYNSLRNTYNKWASDLMQMKNSNGRYQNGYSDSDKRNAQSEMKRIRQSAMQKWGKEIPYNSMEDWK